MTQYALLGAGVVAGSLLSAGITWPVRNWLLKKSTVQPISENAPEKHRLKHGTPTMGGISILLSILVAGTIMILTLPSKSDWKLLALLLLVTCFGGLIGGFCAATQPVSQALQPCALLKPEADAMHVHGVTHHR